MNVKITLDDTLKAADISRNKLAVEGKIRAATISDLCNGKSKSISFETLTKIVTTLNELTGKQHEINDIITIEYSNKDEITE